MTNRPVFTGEPIEAMAQVLRAGRVNARTNRGVDASETAFARLFGRNTRPPSPTVFHLQIAACRAHCLIRSPSISGLELHRQMTASASLDRVRLSEEAVRRRQDGAVETTLSQPHLLAMVA